MEKHGRSMEAFSCLQRLPAPCVIDTKACCTHGCGVGAPAGSIYILHCSQKFCFSIIVLHVFGINHI